MQQQYFTDAITKAILPTFESGSTVNPFGLVYWPRDPDGTQHNNGDSLNSLTPGINGPTSQASIKNASNNLQQILDYLRNTDDPNNPGHKLIDNTDIFVTADHGFGTITKRNLDTTNTAKIADYASTQTYFTISVNSTTGATSGLRQDVNSGFLPPGFLAIDIHEALFPTCRCSTRTRRSTSRATPPPARSPAASSSLWTRRCAWTTRPTSSSSRTQ